MTDNFRTATVGIYDLTLTLVGTSYHMQGGPHGSHIISAAHTSSERLDAHWAGYIDTAYKAQSTPHSATVVRIVREDVAKECSPHCPPDEMDILFAVSETMETLFANAGAPIHSFLDAYGCPLSQVETLRQTSVALVSSALRGDA